MVMDKQKKVRDSREPSVPSSNSRTSSACIDYIFIILTLLAPLDALMMKQRLRQASKTKIILNTKQFFKNPNKYLKY